MNVAVNDIARVYAGSIVELCDTEDKLNQLEAEMKVVSNLVLEDFELKHFFDTPTISKDSKIEFVNKTFSKQFSESTVDFISVLFEHNRQSYIGDIYDAILESVDKINNRKRVTVISSEELDKKTVDKISSELTVKLKSEIVIEQKVESDIIGGIIIKIGDLVIDGSVAKDLKKIKSNLLNSEVRSEIAYED